MMLLLPLLLLLLLLLLLVLYNSGSLQVSGFSYLDMGLFMHPLPHTPTLHHLIKHAKKKKKKNSKCKFYKMSRYVYSLEGIWWNLT